MAESNPKIPKTYDANCHCGLIRYTVTLDEALAPEGAGKVNRCNCSICTKNGYLLVYPKREDVKFRDNCDAKLKSHLFATKTRPHRFCPDCGSSILIDFGNAAMESQRPFLAVNTRMFKDIDFEKAEYSTFDGRTKLVPHYEV